MMACEALPFDVFVVDSGYLRPQMDAIYLVLSAGRVAVIESGTSHSVPRVLAALSSLGLSADAVDWLMLTHVHLDHAGGAGSMMQEFRNARLLVHPRGARHMIDPSKLWAGTVAVYGEEFALREYGKLHAIAAERVVEARDGLVVEFGGRHILVADSPGHARHHVCYWDEVSRGWFSGDAFGLSYRETHVGNRAFMTPATTPTQFDPEAMHRTIERLLENHPEYIYLTHYGRVCEVASLAEDMHHAIDAYVVIARACQGIHDTAEQLAAIRSGLSQHVCDLASRQQWRLQGETVLALYAGDLTLNAQGLQGWLNG